MALSSPHPLPLRASGASGLPEVPAPGHGLDALLGLAVHVAGVPVAAVCVLEDGAARIIGVRGVRNDVVGQCSAFGAVVAAGGGLRLVEEPNLRDPLLKAASARAAVGIPVEIDDRIAGTLVLASPHPDAFATVEDETFEHLARVTGCALDMARETRRLAEQEAHYRAYFEQCFEGIWCYAFEPPVPTSLPPAEQLQLAFERGRLVSCNDAMARMYGFDAAEDLAADPLSRRIPLTGNGNLDVLEAFIENGYRSTDVETVEYDRYGRPHRFSNNVIGMVQDGAMTRVWGTQIDVTEQRAAEEALRESQRLLASISRNISDGIYRSTPDGQILYANEAMAHIFGYERPEDMIGSHAQAYYHDDSRRAELVRLSRQEHGFRNMEVEFVRQDGSVFWGLISCNATLDDEGGVEVFDGAIADITDYKRATEALRESEERYRSLVESHPEPILVSVAGRIVYLNAAAVEMYGAHAPEELLGRTIFEFLSAEDAALMEARRRLVESGQPTEPLEHRITRIDGQERYIETFSVPVLYEGARAAQTVVRDITQRRAYEQGLIEAKERALELARLKDAFLANMSHEIRTPLTSIIGFADVLASDVAPPEDNQEFAHLIRQSGERLMATLNSVLDLAQLEGGTLELTPTAFDAGGLARQVLDLFRIRAAERGLDLALDAPEALPVVLDAGALSRVLTNLVSNALKFTSEGGITVHLAADAETLTLRVEDTGIGISEDFLPHLFDEFQQESSGMTRGYEGSGLGLAITRRLVELMDGRIEVESEKGRGSVFTVSLPRHAVSG